ncbi:MAG: glutamate synthase [Acidobacteria bacterium]|nr:glutamate synthase [Acidobacteriota bacterium]
MAAIDCAGRPAREINARIRELLAREEQIVVRNPAGRHNLGVALLEPGRVRFEGSVGYYCAGLSDGATVEVTGSAGWGLAESMLSGEVVVRGNAGNSAGAAMRGGRVIVHGDAAARAGVSIKGGLLLIGGDCGYMTGFMGQKGAIIVCGDAGEGFADSMYETVCYVGGTVRDPGNDTVVEDLAPGDLEFLETTLARHLPQAARRPARDFKKVVSGRKLWNFDRRDWRVWQEAL